MTTRSGDSDSELPCTPNNSHTPSSHYAPSPSTTRLIRSLRASPNSHPLPPPQWQRDSNHTSMAGMSMTEYRTAAPSHYRVRPAYTAMSALRHKLPLFASGRGTLSSATSIRGSSILAMAGVPCVTQRMPAGRQSAGVPQKLLEHSRVAVARSGVRRCALAHTAQPSTHLWA